MCFLSYLFGFIFKGCRIVPVRIYFERKHCRRLYNEDRDHCSQCTRIMKKSYVYALSIISSVGSRLSYKKKAFLS